MEIRTDTDPQPQAATTEAGHDFELVISGNEDPKNSIFVIRATKSSWIKERIWTRDPLPLPDIKIKYYSNKHHTPIVQQMQRKFKTLSQKKGKTWKDPKLFAEVFCVPVCNRL